MPLTALESTTKSGESESNSRRTFALLESGLALSAMTYWYNPRLTQFELTWEQVDFVRHEVRLSKTKNFSGRSIPMNHTVEAAFKKIKTKAATTKRGEKVFAGYPRKWWEDAIGKSGVVSYRCHDNRHTFCSRFAMRGANLKVIQTLAGQKAIGMTARYADLVDA